MSTPSSSSNPNPSRRRPAERSGRDYTGFGFREVGADDVLDRYLNKEITRESAAFRAAFVKREFRERLDEAESVIGQLRKPMRGPDLSEAILGAVDARKSFVATGARRVVTVGRLAAAACVLLAVGGVVLIERTHPVLSALRDEAAPIGGMVSGMNSGMNGGMVSAANLPGDSTHMPAPCAETAPVQSATNERVPSLMNWTLARLGRVESVEVVRGPCEARIGWDRAGWDRADWDRAGGLRPSSGVATEWSVGFATFPTPDGLVAERRGLHGW